MFCFYNIHGIILAFMKGGLFGGKKRIRFISLCVAAPSLDWRALTLP